MLFSTFLIGLISTLTLAVFPLLFVFVILFEKLANTVNQYKANTFIFSVLVVCGYYLGFSQLVLAKEEGMMLFNNLNLIVSLNFVQIIFFVFYLFQFISKLKTSIGEIGFILFRFLGVIIASLNLSLVAFSNLGPILGSLMVNNDYDRIKQAMLGYSFGLIIPFILILLTSIRFYPKLKESKSWNGIQIVIVITLLIKVTHNLTVLLLAC